MDCYGPLAQYYDRFTGDIPYNKFADLYETEFRSANGEFRLILDLCCGTGHLTEIMARRGYELIAVDLSPDMLSVACGRDYSGCAYPLFLCQNAAELDLYGTVDAAYSALDSVNYIPPAELAECFHRLSLFIRPGGKLIFDIRSEEWLRSLIGNISVCEEDDVFCVWQTSEGEEENSVVYGMDIFSRAGKLWRRSGEEHTEYIYSLEKLQAMLSENSFNDIRIITSGPQGEDGRVFISAVRA